MANPSAPDWQFFELRDLPDALPCSDNILNDIWKLGARATIDSCLGKSTQPAVWQIDPSSGAYVANQRPAMTIEGHSFATYTLEFDAFIDRGGIWWAVTQPLALDGLHIQLTGEMPSRSSFANINNTVTPPNTLLLYRKLATDLARSVNHKPWNKALGTYGYALEDLNTSSVAGTAFCLSSHVASKERAVSAVAALDELGLGLGYKDRSTLDDHDSETKISPNTNGLLLQAILAAEDWGKAAKLIYNVWGAMLKDPETRSGASWEYLTPAGQPGLGAFTSLGHPWGGAATYILTEWVAGLRSADGVQGFRYKNWVVNPEPGVHVGLSHATAKVPLYPSGELKVKWSIKSKKMTVQIKAPPETKGVFWVGKTKKMLENDSSYQFTIQL
ncbi:is able to hydrolyze alpha-1 [Fusarium sp. NRRL 52700]|nr:is able to hydrolyze alpha-1 [Fusarium sp. NRRL 52700]